MAVALSYPASPGSDKRPGRCLPNLRRKVSLIRSVIRRLLSVCRRELDFCARRAPESREKGATDLEDFCCLVPSGDQLGEGHAVNAPDPARQVALVGKGRAGCNVGKTRTPVANELDRTLQSQMHDVTVRRHANRPGEHAREVEWAAARYRGERVDLDGLIEVSDDIVPEPFEHFLAQHAPCLASGSRRVPCDQTGDEVAGNLVPEKRAVWIVPGAFQRQGAGKVEQRPVVTREPLDQLRFERRILCGREREPAWIDHDENGIDASFGIGGTVYSSGTHGERPGRRLVLEDS